MAGPGERNEELRAALLRLASELGVRTAFIGRTFGTDDALARTLVLLRDGEVLENLVYPVSGTPTAHIVDHGACFHSRGVSSMYPDDETLPLFGSESYFGVAVLDEVGRRVGHVAVLDDRPFPDPMGLEKHLRRFASDLAEFLAPAEPQPVGQANIPLGGAGRSTISN